MKNDEKWFLFHVKSSFRSKDIQVFVLSFWYVAKRLDEKDKVNFSFYDVAVWLTNDCNTHVSQYREK